MEPAEYRFLDVVSERLWQVGEGEKGKRQGGSKGKNKIIYAINLLVYLTIIKSHGVQISFNLSGHPSFDFDRQKFPFRTAIHFLSIHFNNA